MKEFAQVYIAGKGVGSGFKFRCFWILKPMCSHYINFQCSCKLLVDMNWIVIIFYIDSLIQTYL